MTKPPHTPEFFHPFQDWSDQGPPACFFGLVVHHRQIKKDLPDSVDDWQEYQIDYCGGEIYSITYNPYAETGTEEFVYRGKIPNREFFEAIMDNMETPLPEGWKTPPVLDSENASVMPRPDGGPNT